MVRVKPYFLKIFFKSDLGYFPVNAASQMSNTNKSTEVHSFNREHPGTMCGFSHTE